MYINNYFEYERNKTRKVFIGNIPAGADEPVRIQSMTDTDTLDTEATVNQIIEIAKAGADYVRLTVQTKKTAEKLRDIKNMLKAKKYDIPLIADIHFSPAAAEVAAGIIEKVRINPGNYADLKQFKHIEYTDEEYASEVEKLKENFVPLLNICKKHNTAIRIGTNHGSLSDRILSRYGDTPLGMVEATMEFLRICKKSNFNDVVISMKASNPLIMIYANRLLVDKMHEEGMSYPLHLGVTEAGNGLEGRIKSASGIGTLLIDGIGDTIRVSLTENPVKEIPAAKKITEIFSEKKLRKYKSPFKISGFVKNYYAYEKRRSLKKGIIGGNNVPVVISDISGKNPVETLLECGYIFDKQKNKYIKTDLASDFLYAENKNPEYTYPENPNIICRINSSKKNNRFKEYESQADKQKYTFVEIDASKLEEESFKNLKKSDAIIVLNLSFVDSPVHAARVFFAKSAEYDILNPVIFKQYLKQSDEHAILKLSGELGALFADGFGDGIWISGGNLKENNNLSFGILQACRMRITKTEYISCPGCGRTLFDLEKVTAEIKKETVHLKGLKIAVMGCIVNGLGEMADADYGYVGAGNGKITLYKNKEIMKKNVPEAHAVKELLKLIEQYS